MCYKNYRMGIIFVTAFVASSINAGDPQREYPPRERKEKRGEELNRSTQLGYQEEASKRVTREAQFQQRHENDWFKAIVGAIAIAGSYVGASWLWSKLTSGKKSDKETQSQAESAAPANSEGQSSASPSDSSPQN